MNRLEDDIRAVLRSQADAMQVPNPHPTSTTVTLVDTPPPPTRHEHRRRWPVIAVAAAAIAAVVVAGLVIATRTDDPTGEVPADRPTTVAPTSTVAPRRETGVFEGGFRHVTYTVPDGWKSLGTHPRTGFSGYGVIKRDPMMGVMFVNADTRFNTNYCTAGVDTPVGPTVDDLVAAWVNLPGVEAAPASDVTVDGFDARQIEFAVPDYKLGDCAGMFYRCAFGGEPRQALRCENLLPTPTWYGYSQTVPNQRREIWVLDVDGTRLMIMAWSPPNISQQDRATLDEIVASIQIG